MMCLEIKLRTVVLLRQLFINPALFVRLERSRGCPVIIILYSWYCFRLAILKKYSFDIKQYYLLIHSFNFHGLTENLIFLDIYRFDTVILKWNAGFVVQETVVYLENQESSYTTNTVEFTVHYCNLFLLHLISEKIWLLLRSFVSLAPEQRNFQWPSNIAVIVTSLYVPTVSASTEHLKPLYRITSLTP